MRGQRRQSATLEVQHPAAGAPIRIRWIRRVRVESPQLIPYAGSYCAFAAASSEVQIQQRAGRCQTWSMPKSFLHCERIHLRATSDTRLLQHCRMSHVVRRTSLCFRSKIRTQTHHEREPACCADPWKRMTQLSLLHFTAQTASPLSLSALPGYAIMRTRAIASRASYES